MVFRSQLALLLFGDNASNLAGVVVPLAIVTPLTFASFLSMVTLSASASGRRHVLVGFAAGAVINLILLVAVVPKTAAGAALAAAFGLGATSVYLLGQHALWVSRSRASTGGVAAADPGPARVR